MNYVIGSGPAGVAAAASLLSRGLPVTLLDAGGELEPDVQLHVARLGGQQPESWHRSDRESVKGPLRYNTEGAPLKLAFGSDYVYRDVDRLQPVATNGVDAYRSLATGGLSVMWGASVLPYSDADLDGWPITASDMAPHYVSALQLTGLAAEDDDLARIFPLHIRPTASLTSSTQARFLADRMARHSEDLHARHIYFGKARLAISEPPGPTRACLHCGMCLYGCPYGLIYSAQLTLRTQLAASKNFVYRPGFIVRKLIERNRTVTIQAVSRETSEPHSFEAERVYLAAGVLASTAILLNSLHAHGRPIALRQSDHFLLPMLLRRWSRRPAGEQLHTLSQLFIEIMDRAVSRHTVHLQVYTYNDLYERMAQDALGPLYAAAAPVVRWLVDHLVLLKGYLHSEESAGIRATLDDDGPTLRLEAIPSPRSDEIIRAVTTTLSRNSRRIGASPLRPGLRKGLPGSGVHVGGSFPMRRHPNEFESDLLGRPTGLESVHVVDSTVFPTVAAPTITLTIMANAMRIASGSVAEVKGD